MGNGAKVVVLLLMFLFVISFASAETYLSDEIINTTGNITAGSYLFGDGRYIENHSTYNATYAANVGNASWNQTKGNELYVNIDGDTMTGQLNIASNLNVTGNVGINSIDPEEELHVDGDILIENSGSLKFEDNGGTNRIAVFAATGTNALYFGDTGNNLFTRLYGTVMQFYVNGTEKASVNESGDWDFNDHKLLDVDDIGSAADEIDDIYIGTNQRIYFGDGQEVSMYYNGSALITG
jgi:hypothetical protein